MFLRAVIIIFHCFYFVNCLHAMENQSNILKTTHSGMTQKKTPLYDTYLNGVLSFQKSFCEKIKTIDNATDSSIIRKEFNCLKNLRIKEYNELLKSIVKHISGQMDRVILVNKLIEANDCCVQAMLRFLNEKEEFFKKRSQAIKPKSTINEYESKKIPYKPVPISIRTPKNDLTYFQNKYNESIRDYSNALSTIREDAIDSYHYDSLSGDFNTIGIMIAYFKIQKQIKLDDIKSKDNIDKLSQFLNLIEVMNGEADCLALWIAATIHQYDDFIMLIRHLCCIKKTLIWNLMQAIHTEIDKIKPNDVIESDLSDVEGKEEELQQCVLIMHYDKLAEDQLGILTKQFTDTCAKYTKKLGIIGDKEQIEGYHFCKETGDGKEQYIDFNAIGDYIFLFKYNIEQQLGPIISKLETAKTEEAFNNIAGEFIDLQSTFFDQYCCLNIFIHESIKKPEDYKILHIYLVHTAAIIKEKFDQSQDIIRTQWQKHIYEQKELSAKITLPNDKEQSSGWNWTTNIAILAGLIACVEAGYIIKSHRK